MNTSDALILEFIDGTLDPAREQELFALMAAHPELRETLRQHVTIGDAVRADRVAYAPPASLELGIFRSLGLSAPTAAAVVARTPWWKGAIGASMSGLAVGIMATVLVLGTGLVTINRTTALEIEPIITTMTTGDAIAAAIPELEPQVEVIHSTASPAIARMEQAPPRIIERIRYIERPARAAMPVLLQKSAEPTALAEGPVSKLHETEPQNSTATTQVAITSPTTAPAVSLAASTPLEDGLSSRSLLTAEIRRSFGGGDMTSVTTASAQQSMLENMAGGLYYSVSDSFAVGIEGGYERYAQVLRPVGSDTVMIEQRPAYLWGGATVRYIPGAIPGTSLRPLFQGTLGATGAGPLVRGRLGATLELGEAFGLNAGFEVGTLFYRYNGTTLASGRWGLTTGLEFKLP